MVVGGGLINYIVNKTIGRQEVSLGMVVGKYRLLVNSFCSSVFYLLSIFYYFYYRIPFLPSTLSKLTGTMSVF
jgi:hypothetical protein